MRRDEDRVGRETAAALEHGLPVVVFNGVFGDCGFVKTVLGRFSTMSHIDPQDCVGRFKILREEG